jgi:hypothetical protein
MSHALPNIIPRRGKKLPDTNVFTEFTAKELDAIAPLQQGDEKGMGEFDCPTTEMIERMDERIQAAKRLKYGGCA